MPTFDPSTIDPTKPTTGEALTADVRANEDATQTNLEGAFNDVAALEGTAPTADQKAALDAANAPSGANPIATIADADQAGHVIQSDGVPVANDRPNLNFSGSGVSVQDNAGNDSTDVLVDNPNVANLGGGAEIYIQTAGVDPGTVELRTITSNDASVILTQGATTVDLAATGAGGGESNTQTNIGGGLAIGLAKNGVDLPIRTLAASQFSAAADVISIPAGVFDPDGSADVVQSNLDSHTANGTIHFPVSSLPGDGLQQVSTALAVDATVLRVGSPFTNGDLAVAATGPNAVRSAGFPPADVARISVDNTFFGVQVIDAPGAATYAFLPGIGGAETRNFIISAVAGNFTWQPLDSGLSAVNTPMEFSHDGGLGLGNPTGGTPATAGHINAKAYLIDNVPVAGADPNAVSSVNPTVDGEVQLGDSATRGLKGSGVAMDRVLRDDNPATIGEVGIDATPTALDTADSPVSPTLEGNAFYDLDGLDATVVNLPTTGNGTLCIQVSNTVPAVTFNPPPDVESGTFLSGTPWRAYITRIGSTRMVEWVG